MRARPFFSLIAAAAHVAAACGFIAVVPCPTPVYALQSRIVYHAEVAVAVFAATYLVAICIRLAWHGRTLTRIGSTLDVPDVSRIDDDALSLHVVTAQLTAEYNAIRRARRAIQPDDMQKR